MDPITAALAERGIARLVDFVFSAAQTGLERAPIVAKVREMEGAGASPDEITDALQAMRKESEAAAQKKIDAAS